MPDRAAVLHPGSLTDVAGLAVGHRTRSDRPTGCTVVLCPQGVVCGVDQRGGAPGTRETDLLEPSNMVQAVQGICLSGGSAFGLDDGAIAWITRDCERPAATLRRPPADVSTKGFWRVDRDLPPELRRPNRWRAAAGITGR